LPEVHLRRQLDLPADCAGPTADGHGELADCPRCQDFLARNPAYVYLPRRRARLSQDAVGLAVRAHLSIARGLLAASGQVDRAMTELAAAITVSAKATMTVRTRQAVLRMILGRVEALTETSRQQIHRLDEAVVLVEKALPVVGAPGRDTLTLTLADLLIDRGVWTGSSCRDFGIKADLARAVADLRRALELNPESARARDNLARAQISFQDELPRADAVGRLAALLDALALVHSGLERAAESNRLRESLGDVLGAVESLLLANLSVDELGKLAMAAGDLPLDAGERARVLAEQAERHRADGDLTGCARDMVRATRADPANPAMRTGLLAALEALLRKLREAGGHDR
jgi:tetratricopeptide (TPR) repeat protein